MKENSLYRILGQSAPAAATATSLYTTPSSCQTECSVIITNRSTADTIAIALLLSGETIDTKHYIAYDVSIGAGKILQITELFLNTGDQIVVYSTNGTCSFTATGMEINRSRMAVE